MKLSITKAAVDALDLPQSGKVFYFDTKLKGFGVYCTKTGKMYFAEGRVNGKTVRTVIGRHGVFFPDKARDEARDILVRIAKGENPNETGASSATLRDAIDGYLRQRTSGQGRQIKDKTLAGYRWLLDTPLKPWSGTPLSDVTESLVSKIHKKITDDRGPVCANNSLRLVRATLNYEGVAPNPVEVLAKKALWNEDKRRSRFIDSGSVGGWIKAAENIGAPIRGAILMMLFLGLRKNEVMCLRKSDIREQSVFLTDTKNGDSHSVPIGPYLWRRIEPLLNIEGEWLFPSRHSASGHIEDPRDAIASLGLKISAHDLRRTFVSHLNALEPSPSAYTIKRLMNHRAKPSDVTAGYIQIEDKKLRDVITRLESEMVGTN